MSENDNDSDIVKDFLVESYENLDRLDRDLVGLEKNPQDKEALERRREATRAWKIETLTAAYDKVGKKSPVWDEAAHQALAAFMVPFANLDDVFKPAK